MFAFSRNVVPLFALWCLFSLYLLVNANSNSTDTAVLNPKNQTSTDFDDSQGRSFLGDIPREGRIINDEKISIKGFIPIVGIGENDNKEKNDNNRPKLDENYFAKYMKNLNPMSSNQNNQEHVDYSNLPQHVARPEDQRYIGAVFQGLLGNPSLIKNQGSFLKPKINRKSDCVCVPFYMCKNGYLSDSGSGAGDYYPAMYQQRQRPDNVEPNDHKSQAEAYFPINERSTDDLNLNDTKFTEEILGRMIGGKSLADGCGLLRTCCQRSMSSQLIPTDFAGNMDYISQDYHSGGLPYRPSNHPQYPAYKPITSPYYKPPVSYNPTMRPSYQQRPYRPPKLINSPSQFEPMIESPLPVPVRNDQIYQQSLSQFAYDKCGSRQSVGINGRVQNLNYHESSTEFGEFPWQAAILKRLGPSDNLYACGGALVSSSFVITAAHCIKKFQAQDLKIRLGEWDVHREDEFYPYIEKNVEEILIHPHFSPRTLANDIAILRIESDIDFNQHPHITPICMADPFESFNGHRCYVSGWGKNAFGQQGEYQSVLMKVDLPVIETRMCESLLKRTKLGYSFRLDRSMICAGGEPGKDACEGDGGSGLVCEVNGTWKVAGLVSWGLGCGQAGVPGVYTNIASVRSWVDKVVFPYYSNLIAAKSTEKNFNDLINERSFGANDNSTIIENYSSKNSTKNST